MEMKRAITVCRERNIPVSIDLNYRSKLWTTFEAGRVMSGLLPLATLLIASESDAKQLFGIEGADFPAVADQLQQRFGIPAVACFRRTGTSGWRDRVSAVLRHQTNLLETEWYDVEVVDRLGAGDAFAAGLIDGLLEGDPWRGLEWGTAMGALKHTIPGDLPILTRADVEGVLSGQGMRIRR
jgi:2-dehydro-3-deoxygluconokinase